MTARLVIDPAFTVAEVDERLFGSFVEHMGRAVYGGIYEPDHPTADDDGFRGDVLELARELGVTRRPLPGRQLRLRLRLGGRRRAARAAADAARPRLALDRAQRRSAPTSSWRGRARRARSRCCAVNLGTRGVDAARGAASSTATRPRGTPLGRLARGERPRRALRRQALVPRQRDGRAVAGRAEDRGRVRPAGGRDGQGDAAASTRRSSCAWSAARTRSMPTFGAWEDTVLDLAWDVADHISLHTYYDPANYPDLDAYLALLARPRPDDRHGRRDRRRGRRAQALPQADRASASTSGTSGTRRPTRTTPASRRPVQARARAWPRTSRPSPTRSSSAAC